MSHVGNGERDLDDLKGLKLPPALLEDVKQARIEARDIINRLESLHITSWALLIKKLEFSLSVAKRNQKFFGVSQVEHRVLKSVLENKRRV